MLTLPLSHPDAESFITAKLDLHKINHANLSIKVSDEEMMEYVRNIRPSKSVSKFSFGEAIQYSDSSSRRKDSTPSTSNIVRLLDLVADCQYKSAEPGLLFFDRILRESPADCYAKEGFATISTNPCQPANATVLSKNGIVRFGDIRIGDEIWSKEGWTTVVNKISTGVKPVNKYSTTFGSILCTEDHRILDNNVKVKAKNAENIDVLRGLSGQTNDSWNPEAIIDGIVLGDGSVHKKSNNLIFFYIGRNDQDYFTSEIADKILTNRPAFKESAYEVKTTITANELPKTFDRIIPARYFGGDYLTKCSFLRGLYSANGSVVAQRVTLKASSRKLIEQAQEMLNSLGILSYITTNKTTKVLFSNGEYACRESYDLNITRDKETFRRIIGFIQKYKNDKLDLVIGKSDKHEILSKKIVSVEECGEQEVFDITVSNASHTYWSGGFNVSNCGEMPLSKYDSCRLMHMNLTSYVSDPFTDHAEFDFDSLARDVIMAQRLLDDAIDIEIENIDRIIAKINSDPEDPETKRVELNLWQNVKQVAIAGRRTGLGHTGLADVFAALGIPYGSDESIKFGTNIQKEIALNSYKSSIIMASERGPFPIFNHCNENNHIFLEKIFEMLDDEEPIMNLYAKHGRRNISNLTIAPTGTVSILAGCSGGIEPVFDVYYKRKVKKSNSKVEEWTEYDVVHPWFKLWYNTVMLPKTKIPIETMTRDQIQEVLAVSPYYMSLANDIDPIKKINLVGSMQKYVDNAISVTHNLKKGVDPKLIKEMIVESFLKGCKGFTVYVDGSRDGVLTHSDGTDTLTTFSKIDAIKRPEILTADLHITTINGQVYCVAIGTLEGSPYEVFAFTLEKPEMVDMLKDSKNRFSIIKVRSGRYDLKIDDNTGKHIFTIGRFNKQMDSDAEVICRILSTGLRHGVDITFLYEQIQSTSADVNNFAKAVSRTFKKYVNNDTMKRKSIECPNCHSATLVFQEGCVTCPTCGYSKC